jgi:osmotically-inducible protein OsmY
VLHGDSACYEWRPEKTVLEKRNAMQKTTQVRQTVLTLGIVSALMIPAVGYSQGSQTDVTGQADASVLGETVQEAPMLGEQTAPDEEATTAERGRVRTQRAADVAVTLADHSLNTRIREALQNDIDPAFSAVNIQLSTDNGKVTLQGSVATDQEKEELAAKVEQVAGVKTVENQLTITSQL